MTHEAQQRVVILAGWLMIVALINGCLGSLQRAESVGRICPPSQQIADTDVQIPEPIVLPVVISSQPRSHVKDPPYVPTQLFAPYPDRLLEGPVRNLTSGIPRLAPDQQRPLPDGMELFPSAHPAYELSHRRAGVWCQRFPMLRLRMERMQLADLQLAIREDGKVRPLSQFNESSCSIRPGRVIYQLRDNEAGLKINIVVLMPLVPEAYGCLARVEIENVTAEARNIDLIAIAKSDPPKADFFVSETPPPPVALPEVTSDTAGILSLPASGHGREGKEDFSILIGFDRPSSSGMTADNREGICSTALQMGARSRTATYLIAVFDALNSREAEMSKRISRFFGREGGAQPDFPESVREYLIEQGVETFARIAADGDEAFEAIRADAAGSFSNSLTQWDKGVYRQSPVQFEMTDKKLQALANLIANNLFPGLVQPPGLVHDAQHGDGWGFIFCYRHVHAASDIALEPQALDYLRLLGTNAVQSLQTDFLKNGHPTLFQESYVDSVWHYYKWTGDLEGVRQLWPALQYAMTWLDERLDPDGDGLYEAALHQWNSDFAFRHPSSSFQSALVWRALTDMAEFAELLGYSQATDEYNTKAEKTRQAMQSELWSEKYAIMGRKLDHHGPLDLHPGSLEIEVPVWTGAVDPFQAQALLDWSSANLEFTDEAGGRWLYCDAQWPAVWSRHVPAVGDALMVGWAHMLAGRHDIGNSILRAQAAASFRHPSPGLHLLFNSSGVTGGDVFATNMGAFVRALVEGTFGVRPALDRKEIVLRPHFPSDWDHARFVRPGLDFSWEKNGDHQTVRVKTYSDIRAVLELSVNSPVTSVSINGRVSPITITPAMYWGIVRVTTPPGGGEVIVRTKGDPARFDIPEKAAVGKVARINIQGVDELNVIDRFDRVDVVSASADSVMVRPRLKGTGRCLFFLECKRDNLKWIQPVGLQIGPRTAKEAFKRTVDDPLPAGTNLVPVDLSAVYTDDTPPKMGYSYGGGPLERDLPTRVRIGEVPFLLGPIGPDKAAGVPDTIHLMNRKMTIQVGRNLQKFFLLSLNTNHPGMTYLPMVEVLVHYTQGDSETTYLIPPVNFDNLGQDYGINTVSLQLPLDSDKMARNKPMGYDLNEVHLTMTDVICDPSRTVESIELRSIAAHFYLAGFTLAERSVP